jgi:hypothetical protein
MQQQSSVQIGVADTETSACAYTGTLSQAGQMASLDGAVTCPGQGGGSFAISELQVNPLGITFRLATSAQPSGCSTTGWFAGARLTTF